MKTEVILNILRKLVEVVCRFCTRGPFQAWICLKVGVINGLIRVANRYTSSSQVFCPCCSWCGYDFFWLDCGSFFVPHVLCPGCGAQERHRLLHFLFRQEFKPTSTRNTLTVLHFAPEHHVYNYFDTESNERYIGADFAFHVIEHLQFPSVQLDMQHLPFPDNVFDLVMCFHVLEHVPNDREGLDEIHRVLAQDGQAIIIVPFMMGQEQTIEYGGPDPAIFEHVRGYSPNDFAERLEQFSCRAIYPKDLLTKEQIHKYGIPSDSQVVYVCRK